MTKTVEAVANAIYEMKIAWPRTRDNPASKDLMTNLHNPRLKLYAERGIAFHHAKLHCDNQQIVQNLSDRPRFNSLCYFDDSDRC